MSGSVAALEEIAARVRVCTRCELCRGRTLAVPGHGNPHAEIMFIGEAPGWNEDREGLPFVGAAGKFLNEMLAAIDLTRDDVYVTNVVKCRPPGNRDPLPDEIAACRSYLEEQIEAINPPVIVTLGRYSMAKWFPNERISRIHGQPRDFGKHVVVPMYHPAAALHQASLKETIQADMLKLPRIVAEVREKRTADETQVDEPEQLRLF
ncbi:MAG: uracil-DNA glycosylase [Chloroflexi bacterium]|nr:MAG: uracil-DNA glycosylase [Chloroflexota bacterium]